MERKIKINRKRGRERERVGYNNMRRKAHQSGIDHWDDHIIGMITSQGEREMTINIH